MNILIHFGLETIGGLGLRCILGLCDHKHHRFAAWMFFGLLSSYATVQIVG